MRDLILKMSISVDGFVSDLDGGNRWMFGADPEAKTWSVATLWTAGLHIMGRRTFGAMAGHWPTATDMFAPPMNDIPKAVFARHDLKLPETPQQAGGDSWADAYVARGHLADEIAMLKAQPGKPIIAHGGVGFARSLVAHGLVDQFILLVIPVALGTGLPIFSDLAAPLRLRLIESKAFPGGAVAQTYRPA
ncbi:MAG TPA: dihydrofolate reductase family protein [Sphingomonas sp.]|jgi:dihydrofolate reductase|uniref:dihydrofolate reductase family protein n=1 Tax=Sphingomonas sp. TaxID=28214 RepID=UPI002ED965C4